MTKHVRIVLADDHFATRQGLVTLLDKQDDFVVVGEASDGLEALEMVESLEPDVLVTDVSMPAQSGLNVIRQMRQRFNNIPVVVLSMHTNDQYVAEALQLGASAYVLKNASWRDLVTAVKEAMAGRHYLSEPLDRRSREEYLQMSVRTGSSYDSLTNREREVLQLAAEGHTNAQIANILGIGTRTVETHRSNLMRKLNLDSSADLVRYAFQQGVISVDD